MHARIALYDLTSGTAEDVVRKAESEGGMVEIFRQKDGFVSYELIHADGAVISSSRWNSAEQADAATEAAAVWVEENIADLVVLRQNFVGDVVLSTG